MLGKERNNQELDQNFTDRSWAEMQKILDAEMPQTLDNRKGKKRYLLLLLFLLVGFGSGVGTMFYFNQLENLEIPAVPEKVKKEIAETSDMIENQELSIQHTEKENSRIKTENTQRIENSIEAPISKSIVNNNLVKNDFAIDKTSNFAKVLDPKLVQTSESHLSEFNNSQNPNEKQNHSESANSNLESIPTLEFIATKTTNLDVPNELPKLKILPTPKTKKWSFGILAGNFSNNNALAAGFTLGGKATYDLDRRFTIGGGLQYSLLSGFKENSGWKSRNTDRAMASPLEEFDNGQDTSGITNNSEFAFVLDNYAFPVPTNSDLPISNLQYLEMPIEFAYRFSEKFQMNLGAKAGYLINSKSDESVSFDNNSLSSNEKQNEQIFRKSLNRFDIAASVGVGFYPLKKVGIDLRYNHGFVDITKNDSWPNNESNTNQNIQLSVLYFFGKK